MKIIPIVAAILLLTSFVVGHSLYLFDIKLDFDKDLETNVIKSAKEFMKTDKDPLSFDLDKGLIIAHFEPDNRKYVRINPIDYKVYGMQDETLRHSSGTIKFTKQQAKVIAQKLFDTFPKEISSEFVYDNDISELEGTYYFKWFRYKDGILVVGDDLFINVDAVNGNIIGYRVPILYVPKEKIITNPAITLDVAKKVAEIYANDLPLETFQPYIVSYNGKLVWVNKLEGQFYPYYYGIDASDGSMSFVGILPGEVPESYSKGKDVPVVETDFIKNIYGEK